MSHFHLFVQARSGLAPLPPASATRVGRGLLSGTLYRLESGETVLMLYGSTPVRGEIWRCPADELAALDLAAGTAEGRLRRVARRVTSPDGGEPIGCWLYVAGPGLSRELLPDRRLTSG